MNLGQLFELSKQSKCKCDLGLPELGNWRCISDCILMALSLNICFHVCQFCFWPGFDLLFIFFPPSKNSSWWRTQHFNEWSNSMFNINPSQTAPGLNELKEFPFYLSVESAINWKMNKSSLLSKVKLMPIASCNTTDGHKVLIPTGFR